MSVVDTQQEPTPGETPRQRLNRPRPSQPRKPVYKPFRAPEGLDGLPAVRHHRDWLLANMDWFALQGTATLNSASLALHRDFTLLARPAFVETVATAAAPEPALDQPAVAAVIEEQRRQIEELQGRIKWLKAYGRKIEERLPTVVLHPDIRSSVAEKEFQEIVEFLDRIYHS